MISRTTIKKLYKKLKLNLVLYLQPTIVHDIEDYFYSDYMDFGGKGYSSIGSVINKCIYVTPSKRIKRKSIYIPFSYKGIPVIYNGKILWNK